VDEFQQQVAKIKAEVDAAHPEYRRPPEAIPLWLIINAKVNNDCELLTALSVARLIDELRRDGHTSVTLIREKSMTPSLRPYGRLLMRVRRQDERLLPHDLLRAVLDAPARAGQDVVHARAEMPNLLLMIGSRGVEEEIGPLTSGNALQAYRLLSGDRTTSVALELAAGGWFEGLWATVFDRQLRREGSDVRDGPPNATGAS